MYKITNSCMYINLSNRILTYCNNYNDVIMGAMASQITSLTIVYSTVYSGADQRKHQSSATLAFVMGIHRWPVYSPRKGPVTRKMFPFYDVIISFRHDVCGTNPVSLEAQEYNSVCSLRSDRPRPLLAPVDIHAVCLHSLSDNLPLEERRWRWV